uniref:C2H2-type domain-containing protein n=1 Tax=Heterorhabditis bacteriophora TaxID=37862 RepID=A0A1I7XL53_HETBA
MKMQPIASSFRLQFRVEKQPSLLPQISPAGSKSVRTIKVRLLFVAEDDLNKMELVLKRHMHMEKRELPQFIPKSMTCVGHFLILSRLMNGFAFCVLQTDVSGRAVDAPDSIQTGRVFDAGIVILLFPLPQLGCRPPLFLIPYSPGALRKLPTTFLERPISLATFVRFVLPEEDCPFACKECHRGFYTIKELSEHEVRAHDGRIPCALCEKKAISVTKLAAHMLFRHAGMDVICHFCGEKFGGPAHKMSKSHWEEFRNHVYKCRYDITCNKATCPFDHSNKPRLCMACVNDMKNVLEVLMRMSSRIIA